VHPCTDGPDSGVYTGLGGGSPALSAVISVVIYPLTEAASLPEGGVYI
jgi:hypothetical protein